MQDTGTFSLEQPNGGTCDWRSRRVRDVALDDRDSSPRKQCLGRAVLTAGVNCRFGQVQFGVGVG